MFYPSYFVVQQPPYFHMKDVGNIDIRSQNFTIIYLFTDDGWVTTVVCNHVHANDKTPVLAKRRARFLRPIERPNAH